jgi:hypothetical protein
LLEYNYKVKLFQNFSFGTATLDLREKAGFRLHFPRACGKTIGFWNRLRWVQKFLRNIRIFQEFRGGTCGYRFFECFMV